MKVLKYGEGYPKTIFCDECESTLEYTIEDIKDRCKCITEPDPLIEYIHKTEKYLECPVCGHHITLHHFYSSIKYKEIPKAEPKPKKKRWWQK